MENSLAETLSARGPGVIDRANARPLHRQIYDVVLAAIRDDKKPLRGKLPSERELVALFDVSRITIRHAIRDLVHEGVVLSQPGKGLYVAERGEAYELDVLRSFTSTAIAGGRKPGHHVLAASIIAAPADICRPLSLPPQSEVILLSRLRFLDGEPAMIQTDWIPAAVAPRLLDLDWDAPNVSLYAELRERYAIQPYRGQTTMSARLASAEEAAMLRLVQPAAVLTVDQIAFDRRNMPINMTALVHHPVRFPLTLQQSEAGELSS